MDFLEIAVLVLAGFLGGLVDSVAGGGGLITMPTLLLAGVPPHVALGTNKLQSAFGATNAVYKYWKANLIQKEGLWIGVFFTAVGAGTGTVSIQFFSTDFLSHLVLVMLIVIFAIQILSPQFGSKESKRRLQVPVFYLMFGLSIGFYDGFFGPGTGSFWAMAFVVFGGLSLVRGTATTKVVNLTSNVVALSVFIYFDQVDYLKGGCMILGQIAGQRTGAGLVVRKGTAIVRPLFIVVVGVTILKLIWDKLF